MTPVIVVAWAELTRGCDPGKCRMRARVIEAFEDFGWRLPGARPRQCVDGAYHAHLQRVDAVMVARSVAEQLAGCCWVDHGRVGESVGRRLVEIHHRCEERSCRAKQRGLQAITHRWALIPEPECGVREEQIVGAVHRIAVADAAMQAARLAMGAGRCGAWSAMITATSEAAWARRHRDVLFLRGLPVPGDGTVPVSLIVGLGMSVREVRRLVPGLRANIAPPQGW